MNDPHMVLSIDGYSDRVSHDPVVRKRFGPHGVYFKHRRLNFGIGSRLHQSFLAICQQRDQHNESRTNQQITFRLHEFHLAL